MEKFTTFTSIVLPFDHAHVDTDQIIPKQFLKLVQRTGFGQFLFHNHRFLKDGSPNPDFVLNHERFEGARILLARENFGCGSSREHAPWALFDYGFRAIIAPSIADIFRNNCIKTGILPIELDIEVVNNLFIEVFSIPGHEITINLEDQTVTGPNDLNVFFEIHEFSKRCLIEGMDEIGLTLEQVESIRAYEASRTESWQAHVTGSLPQEGIKS